MKTLPSAFFWISIYLLLVLAPLLLLTFGTVPPGSGFWWDFSMALGFAGMSMMGVQFLLTARFRRASAPFGIDIIYFFHRFIAVIGFMLMLAHFLIIWIVSPAALGSANPLLAPWYMTAGRAAMVLLAVIIVTSLWRKQLRIEYDRWRLWHTLSATGAFVLALVHIEGVGYYIDTPIKHWLWTGYTLFWLLLILYLRLIKPLRMYNRPYQVVDVRQERGNNWTLALEPDGHDGMDFKPGQFAWLTLRASPWHIREHPFSFSSSASRQDRLEFTIKELGDFTRTIKQTRIGEVAYLDGPYGVFSVDRYPDAAGFVFVAGGVGIAPIMSMLRTLADRKELRPLLLFYGNKHWERVVFREELAELKTRLNLQVVHVLLEPPEGWQDESGYIEEDLLSRRLPANRSQLEYFVCGPTLMRKKVEAALYQLGVPLKRAHSELFDLV